jgi:hypothetical protein
MVSGKAYALAEGTSAEWNKKRGMLTITTPDAVLTLKTGFGRWFGFKYLGRTSGITATNDRLDYSPHGIVGQLLDPKRAELLGIEGAAQHGDRGRTAEGGGTLVVRNADGDVVLSQKGDRAGRFYQVSGPFATDDEFSQYNQSRQSWPELTRQDSPFVQQASQFERLLTLWDAPESEKHREEVESRIAHYLLDEKAAMSTEDWQIALLELQVRGMTRALDTIEVLAPIEEKQHALALARA